MPKQFKLVLTVLLLPMLFFGAFTARAASAGQIEGGDIYRTLQGSSEIFYRVRIENSGSGTLQNVTVRATLPTNGNSRVTVCAEKASQRCTSDTASISLNGGRLEYVSGSTELLGTRSGRGDIFSSGFAIGSLSGQTEFVQFAMRKASGSSSGGSGSNSTNNVSPATPQPVSSTNQSHTHQTAAVSQPNQNQSNEGSNNETLPAVNVTAPEVNADQTSSTATETQTNQPATTNNGDNSLATSGSAAGAGALALGLVIGGAFYLKRSRSALTAALLNKAS